MALRTYLVIGTDSHCLAQPILYLPYSREPYPYCTGLHVYGCTVSKWVACLRHQFLRATFFVSERARCGERNAVSLRWELCGDLRVSECICLLHGRTDEKRKRHAFVLRVCYTVPS